MTPVRNEVSIGLSHETCYLVGGLTFGGGRGVFQIALMSRGILVILGRGEGAGVLANFAGWAFFIGRLESEDEWFWPFEPFTKLRHFANNEHQLKSKLARTICTKSMKFKKW